MNISTAIKRFQSNIAHFIGRFHVIIFTLTVVIGVSAALFLLVATLSSSSGEESPTPNMTTFDQTTIDRIDRFNTNDSTGDTFYLPPGRINPLAE